MPKKRIAPKRVKGHVRRALKEKAPKVVENTKKTLFLKGRKTSETIAECLKDMHKLSAPHATAFNRRNDLNPFEDETSLEFLMNKNDTSLFAFGSHNKKRPDNLVIGRTFDGHILDMIEMGVSNFVSIAEAPGPAKQMGSKPALVFQGEGWESDIFLRKAQGLLVDFFRGELMSGINLAGLDHCISFTATGSSPENSGKGAKIHMRTYSLMFKRSGTRVPKVALEEMGPSMDLTVRRTSFPSSDLWRQAIKQPKETSKGKTKNKSTNVFGDSLGRIHLGRQDLNSMHVRRVKALRTVGSKMKGGKGEDGGDDDGDEDGGGGGVDSMDDSDT